MNPWQLRSSFPAPVLSPRAERARLRRHFAATVTTLVNRSTDLSSGRRRERVRLARELSRYAAAARFPRNRALPGLAMPIFVDDGGDRCAVAHLMEVSGAGAEVEAVRTQQNFARVPALAAELQSWLDETGLTLEEAARIQPAYCFVTKAESCLCEGQTTDASGVLEGPVVALTSPARIRVDAIHGEAPGYAVGDELEVYSGSALDQLVLVPVRDGMPSGGSVALGDDAELSCLGVSASRETVIDAMLSSDCAAVLTADNPAWEASQCDEAEAEGGGCAVGHGSLGLGGTTLVALALVGALGRTRNRA